MPGRASPRVAAPGATKARERCRGFNALAELEALCVLGGGDFALGVHHVANLFRRVPLAARSGVAVEDPFADRIDRRHWAAPLYADDAFLLRHVSPSVATGLTLLLASAWPHVGASYRARIDARLAELPDDELARAWAVRGQPRWWAPPRASGQQTHFVVVEDAADHDVGIRR